MQAEKNRSEQRKYILIIILMFDLAVCLIGSFSTYRNTALNLAAQSFSTSYNALLST